MEENPFRAIAMPSLMDCDPKSCHRISCINHGHLLLSSEILHDSADDEVHNHSKEHGKLIPNEQSFRIQAITQNNGSATRV